ncbi:MAG: hypothetical protein HRU41_02065 [Saprospiraceae bacterium]|nr:hypothetical protein [Saprospiraceae bacterium]
MRYLLFSLLLLGFKHDYHLSKCLIEYSTTDQALQVSMQLFIDDLEEALRLQGHDKLALCTSKEAPEAEIYFEEYLKKHLLLTVNGEPRNYNYLGKEISEDLLSLWCYLEIEGIPQISSLNVSNDILMEAYPDQQNIVSVKGPSNQSGMWLFSKGKSTGEVKFK